MNLKRHVNSVHLSNIFNCDVCDYKSTRKSTLNSHKKIAHEGQFYRCTLCDFTTGWKQTLKRHNASKHENKRFSCSSCDFSATRREHLKSHEITAHLGELYKCEFCPFEVRFYINCTGWPDKHGRVVLVPCVKLLVQCTPLCTCTLDNTLFQVTRKARPCLTGHPVFPLRPYIRFQFSKIARLIT